MHCTGIDIGLRNTTIVIMNQDKVIVGSHRFGTQVNDPLKYLVGAHLLDRYKAHAKYFEDYVSENSKNLGTIVMEMPFGNFGGNAIRLAELFGVFLCVLKEYTISSKLFLPNPASIKSFFTGSGASTKMHMIEECKKRGYYPKDEHQADAIAMAIMGIDRYNKET